MERYAGVVELVDSLDLGSNARACRFESCHPHQIRKGGFSLPFLFGWYAQDENPSNAARTSAAFRQLDGGNSFIFISLWGMKMQIESLLLPFLKLL